MLGGGGFHDQGGLRGLPAGGPGAFAGAWAGCGDGQPLKAHKGERVKEIIEGRGAQLLYLPPYSPDFNPIEQAFSKVKGLLRKAEARTRESLIEALGRALSGLTALDARGFFAHCGYREVVQPL
jgi:hypothetical protein